MGKPAAPFPVASKASPALSFTLIHCWSSRLTSPALSYACSSLLFASPAVHSAPILSFVRDQVPFSSFLLYPRPPKRSPRSPRSQIGDSLGQHVIRQRVQVTRACVRKPGSPGRSLRSPRSPRLQITNSLLSYGPFSPSCVRAHLPTRNSSSSLPQRLDGSCEASYSRHRKPSLFLLSQSL
jgi:hypothetical protein